MLIASVLFYLLKYYEISEFVTLMGGVLLIIAFIVMLSKQ
jgi:hypothetical protein